MYELIQAAEHTWYIQCPAKMGLWVPDGHERRCSSTAAATRTPDGRCRRSWRPRAGHLACILNTHANADHNGGNALLQQRLGAPAYAPGIDAAITTYPILEPAFLYGGYPPKPLRNKFLLAQNSRLPSPDGGHPAGGHHHGAPAGPLL